MASRVDLKRVEIMLKKLSFLIFLCFCFVFPSAVFGQTEIPEFYQAEMLKSDLNQVSVVAYVNVKSRKLVDQMGAGKCEENVGGGICLYLLKAEVKKVYKGKISKKTFEFYTTTDSDYTDKDRLLGEKVVFLNWSKSYPNKKMSLGTMENSTRSNEYGIIETMKKVAAKK